MNARLVAIDEGPDIDLDRAMIVVGRHPACDARLDSLRVSRHHCCMMLDKGEVLVRDLGSTNGIRINGQRVEIGRLRCGDELSIAHVRFRLESGVDGEERVLNSSSTSALKIGASSSEVGVSSQSVRVEGTCHPGDESMLAAAVLRALPSSVAHRCKIEVIVRMDDEVGVSESTSEPMSIGFSDSPTDGASE